MAWDVKYRNGIWLPQIDWWLDAHFPVDRSFVSHAHFDHLAPHAEVLTSEGTARLMRSRMPAERREHILPFGHTEALTPDASITLYPAGHIFGSAQCLIEHRDHGRLLYTGDFKLRQGRSAETCATPRADVLIMETTYGRPHYVFPSTEEVLAAIATFCAQALEDDETPVLFGYSLGKSQELLSGLSEARLPVMLHPATHRLTRVYEEMGITFPPYREFNAQELAGHVVICPPQAAHSSFLKKIPKRKTATITGWALDPGTLFRAQCDAAFPLSDHADFPDLIRFVEQVKPQRVLTLHGFASDFARTLRERGIEAWAINQDNQLEMALGTDNAVTTIAPASVSLPVPLTPAPALEEHAFLRFTHTAEALKSTTKKSEKVRLLATYFESLSTDDAALAALYFTGRPFPQNDGRTLNLGWSVIRRALLEVTGLTRDDFRRTYLRYSDSGETAEALLNGRTQSQSHSLAQIGEQISALASLRGPLQKLELLQSLFRTLSPVEAKYLTKIITGDLRIGLKEGLVEEALAMSTQQPVEIIREANMLSGDLSETVRHARAGTLHQMSLRVFNPVQFMLASPEPTADAILERLAPPVWIEEKYDGIRCQLHKQGTRVELFSRDLHRITHQFPDLAAGAAHQLKSDAVIDGELLAWRDGRALPFAELQKRLGRKGDDFFLGAEIPVSLSCYDLLWLNGRSLLKTSLNERRAALESLLTSPPIETTVPLLLAPLQKVTTAQEIEGAFLAARARGNEGLMAKDPNSIYTPGRRGLAWLKLKKAYATLDVVVVGVEYGHGKRRGVLSDYTFAIRDDESGQLLTVGKAYSGLTDAEIAQYTQHFLDHTLEVKGHYRTVVPDTVLEVAFDAIQLSNRHQSGYALRFPRIARIRTDKSVAEIDTLDTCRRLATAPSFAPTSETPPVPR
ncbi:MAG TPA: ATP-dependent DNA ligase [Opitutaceae bacterium]|nr:ATP-dependent DNA ligase [Opitutaceae bacterium]